MPERTDHSSPSARPILVTRKRAAFVVILSYLAAALTAALFFSHIETVTGHDDARDQQLALLFAALMAAFCLRSLVGIYRRPKALDLVCRPEEALAGARSRSFRRFAAAFLRDLARILAPRVLATLSRSLYWATFGRLRAHDFAIAFYVGAVFTMLVVEVAVRAGMAISPPMMCVLLVLGGYLTGTLYSTYTELKGRYSTPELEATRALHARSEAAYAAIEDHAEQMRRAGATPREIAAETASRRRVVVARKLHDSLYLAQMKRTPTESP